MMRRMRFGRIVQGLLLAALGVVASLAVLELAMQIGAVGVRLGSRGAPGPWATGARRVLSLGDSFTYGLFVERHEAYPAAFESLWNEQESGRRIEVMNLGFPGTNSFQVRNEFSRMLRMFSPEIVTIMIGGNDYWTVRPRAPQPSVWDRVAEELFQHSRVVRLAFMVRRAMEKNRLVVKSDADGLAPECPQPRLESAPTGGAAAFGEETFSFEWRRAEGRRATSSATFESDLRQNIFEMVSQARAHDVEVVLLTYPTGVEIYARASAAMRAVAAESGTLLVDVTPLFAPHCPFWTCPILFPDQHPTAQGHRMVAEALHERLRAAGR